MKKWKASKTWPTAPWSPTPKARNGFPPNALALRRGTPGQCRRSEPGRRRVWRPTRAAASAWTKIIAPRVPQHFCRRRCDRLSRLASVSMEQGRIAAARIFGDDCVMSNPKYYPVWDLYDPGNFLHRQNRRAVDRRGCSVRGRRRVLSRNCARPDSRRHHWPAQADLSSRDAPAAGRAHHRRRRQRTGPHRPGGHGAERQPSTTSSTPSSTIRPWRSATKPRPSTV